MLIWSVTNFMEHQVKWYEWLIGSTLVYSTNASHVGSDWDIEDGSRDHIMIVYG